MNQALKPRALITGASGGIGYELAKLFAKDGTSLVIVARQEDQLRAIKADFEQQYGIQVDYQALDLSQPGQPQALYDWCQAQPFQVDFLVNNAGYGDYRPVAQADPAVYENMLALNVVALTTLTTLFVQQMVKHQQGRILNVGSLAAFQPVPQMAAYAASKSYVMHFTEALHAELRGTGVSATVLNPNVTKTGFVARAGMGKAANAQGKQLDPAQVARAGYQGLLRGALNVVPGWGNKLLALSTGLMPSRRLLLAIATRVSRVTK
ncbi:SDR family NAD(P)-dependent oxidoreductase [uncultured Hymenobacter sp.]|uniref:SDR family NAD(P)-dependent oxidoreductase n=1 Tax=uncultured Hymenobacter sp. TaxID=170016 RepID=UPI0035C95405